MNLLLAILPLLIAPAAPQVAPAPPGIVISMDVNGVTEPTVYRGWPIILTVVVRAEEGASVKLATAGPWSDSVTLAAAANGGNPAWPMSRVGMTPAAATLGELDRSDAVWTVAPEFTHGLAAGSYQITAVLNTTTSAVTGGWRGVSTARPLSVRIIDEPKPLSANDQIWKLLLESSYAELRGNSTAALSVLDAWLAKNPSSVTVLSRKAAILERLSRPRDALAVVGQALDLLYKAHPKPEEPPIALIRLQDSLTQKLMK
jgi:hypothetical protein